MELNSSLAKWKQENYNLKRELTLMRQQFSSNTNKSTVMNCFYSYDRTEYAILYYEKYNNIYEKKIK